MRETPLFCACESARKLERGSVRRCIESKGGSVSVSGECERGCINRCCERQGRGRVGKLGQSSSFISTVPVVFGVSLRRGVLPFTRQSHSPRASLGAPPTTGEVPEGGAGGSQGVQSGGPCC